MKKVYFVGSSREDLKEFPDEVRQDIGFALYLAQCERSPKAGSRLLVRILSLSKGG